MEETNISMEQLYQDLHPYNMESRGEDIVFRTEILINQDMRGDRDQHRIGKVIHPSINRVLCKEMDAILELHRTIHHKVHREIMVPQGLEKGEILHL